MYSTDDDLFSTKRAGNTRWTKPTDKQRGKDAPMKSLGNVDYGTSRNMAQEDESSDDFLYERDSVWTRKKSKQCSSSAMKPSENARTRTEKNQSKAEKKEESDTDFEFVPKRGAALLARFSRSQATTRRSGEHMDKTPRKSVAGRSSSSCSDDIFERSGDVKQRTNKLLQRSTREKEKQKERQRHGLAPYCSTAEGKPKSSSDQKMKTVSYLQKEKMSSTQQRPILTLGRGDQQDERRKSIGQEFRKCFSSRCLKRNEEDLVETIDDIKEFIGGQLRKGIDKAMASAVMKLNEKLRNEAESSNSRMELLMKGMMDSYDLISNKVSELTQAYNAVVEKYPPQARNDLYGHLQEKVSVVSDLNQPEVSKASVVYTEQNINQIKQESSVNEGLSLQSDGEARDLAQYSPSCRRSRSCSRPRPPSDRSNKTCGLTLKSSIDRWDHRHETRSRSLSPGDELIRLNQRDKDTAERSCSVIGTLDIKDRLDCLETEVLKTVERMKDGPNASELRSICTLLDDHETKLSHCCAELSKLRNESQKRQQKTRAKLQSMTDNVLQLQSTTLTKEAFAQTQIEDFTEQLTTLKDVVHGLTEGKRKTEEKITSSEQYVNQIYKACKSTLKSVDLRYQTLKKSYQDVQEKQRVTDAKCNALAESLAILHQKQKPKK